MKPIFLTPAAKADLKKELEAAIERGCLFDGSFSFQKKYTCANKDQKITIYYTSSAFCKMYYLIESFKSEIGWHGLIKKLSDTEFLIYDILVFKQNVTGSTVTPDEEDYTKFLMSLSDEEAAHMHMHGHSHVNMGVTPSSVDTNFQRDIVATMNNKGFYLFQIWNKSLEVTSILYDFDAGVMYEKKDIEVDILDDDGISVASFVQKAEKLVHDTTPRRVTSSQSSSSGYNYSSSSYNSNYYRGSAYAEPYNYYDNQSAKKNTKDSSSKKSKKANSAADWQNRIDDDDDAKIDAYVQQQFGSEYMT